MAGSAARAGVPGAVRLVLAALLAATLPVAATVSAHAQKMPALDPVPGARVGNLAQDFTLKDLDDHKHSLKDLRGQQVAHVVFWATWCMPCLQEVPALRAIHEKYKDRGLQVLGIVIDQNQTPDKVRLTAKDMKIGYPILWDGGGTVQDRYRVDAIPQNFLIGKDGVIRWAGSSLPANYDAILESLLDQKAAAPATAAGR